MVMSVALRDPVLPSFLLTPFVLTPYPNFLKAVIAMKRITKQTGLITILFVQIFLSNSAHSETVFKCKAYAEQGKTFSVVMPEVATEYLASVQKSGDASVLSFSQEIGVGSITFDNMGSSRWSTKFVVTRRPRPNYSPVIGFFLFSDSPQTLKIDTKGTGPFPFELYDPFGVNGSLTTKGICQ